MKLSFIKGIHEKKKDEFMANDPEVSLMNQYFYQKQDKQ